MPSPSEYDQAISELVEADAALFGTKSPDSNAFDARRYPRFPFRGRAKAVVFSQHDGEEPQETEVLTTDLSRGGVSLLYRKQLEEGQQILLVLNNTNRLVEVCWCCRVWAGLYAAGCQFITIPVDHL